jgi:WD40 repeat protein
VTLKNLRAMATGFLALIVLMTLIGVVISTLLAGTLWVASILAPFALLLACIGTLLLLPLIAVSAVSPRSRRFCGQGIVLVSYSWGIALWMWATLVLYQLWGVFGLVAGLVLVGVGSVPTACVALLFHGQIKVVLLTISAVVIVFAVRALGHWVTAKRKPDSRRGPESSATPLNASTRSGSGQWVVGQAFTEEYESLAVSPAGQISTPVGPKTLGENPKLGDAIEVRNIKDPWLAQFIYMRAENERFICQRAVGFAWSPNGRLLVVATCTADGDPDVLILLDARTMRYVQTLGANPSNNPSIAWSAGGNFLAAASRCTDEDDGPIRLWRLRDGRLHYETFFDFDNPAVEVLGFRSVAFAPDERCLLAIAELAPRAPNILTHSDELYLFDIPSLRVIRRINTSDPLWSFSWRVDQRYVVASGTNSRTFLLDTNTGEATFLPLQAAFCCCHPSTDICAFADRIGITIARLPDCSIVDYHKIGEQDIDTLEVCWSLDGTELFAASGTGRTYIYYLQ